MPRPGRVLPQANTTIAGRRAKSVRQLRIVCPNSSLSAYVSPGLIGIRFVFVRDELVRGTLEPYRDPACGCRMHTVFSGSLKGSTIEGTYRTLHVDTRGVHEGSWLVRRSGAYADAGIHGDDAIREAQ